MSGLRRSLVLGSPRELGTVGLVSGLCGAYAAVLIMTSVFLVTVADEAGGGVAAVLGVVATVFIGIAVYVGAIVIVNAVDTVLAGRLSQIALLRLLGARGRSPARGRRPGHHPDRRRRSARRHRDRHHRRRRVPRRARRRAARCRTSTTRSPARCWSFPSSP